MKTRKDTEEDHRQHEDEPGTRGAVTVTAMETFREHLGERGFAILGDIVGPPTLDRLAGALDGIPRTHRTPAVECVAGRGSVVLMRPLLVHASSKARSAARRRVLHTEYAATLAPQPGVELAIA